MTKYLTPREAFVDFLSGVLEEYPLDSKGRLLEEFDGNDYSGNPNNWPDDDDDDSESFEEDNLETFDPYYHEDYFDLDEVDEYGDEEADYGSYIDRACWDDELDSEDEDEDYE